MTDGDSVEGLRVVVFGASSGIGRAVAVELAARGAAVVASARRLERLQALVGITAVCCDVSDPAQCESAIAETIGHLGGLDALVYATGLSRLTPLDRPHTADWQAIFETNVFGAVHVTRAVLPHLTHSESEGRAMFLTSDSADLAYPGLVAYSASKAALSRFCQGLADEVPALRVSEVVVGPTADTEVADKFDPTDFERFVVRWFEEGFVKHGMQFPSDVAVRVIDALLADEPPNRLIAAAPEEAAATSLDEGRRQVASPTGS